MVSRPGYSGVVKRYLRKPVIKIITGMRRVGKSTLLAQIRADLIEGGVRESNIVTVNKDLLEWDHLRTYRDLDREGRVFLGAKAEPERDYVFSSRDRYDTSYDMIRSARDRRFKYLRHDYPREPYLLWVPYRNEHPIVRELWDGYRRGTLNEDQTALFRKRPAEELYDTATDPYELHSLADDPAYRDELERLRAATADWCRDVDDTGTRSESEMVRRWYPGGVQPTTATPICVPIAEGEWGQRAVEEADLSGPALLQIQCATQGASIAYRMDGDPDDRWRLYTEPIRLPAGTTTVRARAHRIGYKESETVAATLRVR